MIFNTNETEDTSRDRPFEDFRIARTEKAKSLVADVLNQLQHYEEYFGLRKRKRKAVDQRTFEATVEAIVCDLCHRWLTVPEGWVAISLAKDTISKADRYKSPAMNKTLPRTLERLSSPEMSFVELQKGFQAFFGIGKQSTMRAGTRLISRIEDLRLTLNDLGIGGSREVIILKNERADVFTGGKPIDYKDDERTRLYREQMHRINDWLCKADIYLDPYIGSLKNVNGSDRLLRRIFNNNSFEAGGRLFGGFWQSLSKRERFRGIRIEGSPIVALDYAQMAPRILYGMAGVNPPEGDLYWIFPFWNRREGVKKVFNAMLNVDKPLERFPSGTRALFRRSTKIQEVVEAIAKHHEPLRKFFFTKVGFRVMFIESQIMVQTLLSLMDRGIVGLPIHDGLLVAQGNEEAAKEIMLRAFQDNTGITGEVTIEDKLEV